MQSVQTDYSGHQYSYCFAKQPGIETVQSAFSNMLGTCLQEQLRQWRSTVSSSSREWKDTTAALRAQAASTDRHCCHLRTSISCFQSQDALALKHICIQRYGHPRLVKLQYGSKMLKIGIISNGICARTMVEHEYSELQEGFVLCNRFKSEMIPDLI